MSVRACAGGCGTELSGRRKRCDDCRRARRTEQERQRYADHADAINTRRTLRRHGASEYIPADSGEVVDYTQGGLPGAGLAPPAPSSRQHWTHDSVTRAARIRAANRVLDEDEPGQATWAEVERRAAAPEGNYAYFPAPPGSPAYCGNNPFYGDRGPSGPPDNPAAAGQIYVGHPVIDTPARGHLAGDRFGRR